MQRQHDALNTQQMNEFSQTHGSYHNAGVLKGSSKRLRKSTDIYSGVANNQNFNNTTTTTTNLSNKLKNANQSQHHLPPMKHQTGKNNLLVIPRIEGH